MANGMQKPGDVEVDSINIINSTGNVFDLYNQFASITIFESIFTNTMSGEIVIVDALNLLENYSIIGQEKLIVKFKTAGKENLRVNQFNIYKISNRSQVKERVQTYILHFTSEETLLSLRQKISKAYSGRVSDIAGDIYTDYLDDGNKICYAEKTQSTKNCIIPYWTPLYALNFLTHSAISEDGNINYTFFETLNKFYFVSLSYLYEASPVRDYTYSPVNSSVNTIDDVFRSVKSFNIKSSFDTINNISNGMFASKNRYVDFINKRYGDVNYNYEIDFDAKKHISPNKFTTNTGDFINRKYTHDYMSSYYLTPTDDLNIETKNSLKRKSALYELSNVSLLLDVYGDSELECGHMINFHLPSSQPIYNEKVIDRYISGKFIITSIRHDITKDSYDMILEISKDSLENQLPDYAEYTKE